MKTTIRVLSSLLLVLALIAVDRVVFFSRLFPFGIRSELCSAAKIDVESKIRISDIVKSDWDRLFIFSPYSSTDRINSSLGFEWSGARFSGIQMSDGFNLLVFTKGMSVVEWTRVPRDCGDYNQLFKLGGYTRDQAVFKPVIEDLGGPWIVMTNDVN